MIKCDSRMLEFQDRVNIISRFDILVPKQIM